MLRNSFCNVIIQAKNIGKKYGTSWVFRALDFEVEPGKKVAITGKNGAGKSTLLQILSGYLTASEGSVTYDGTSIDMDRLDAVYIGPYTDIIEEMTLRELLTFHAHFKKATLATAEMAQRASLPLDKLIVDFSTGMKQRVKLITAFYFENSITFLDEPTSNLDQEGFDWWKSEVASLTGTLLMASNDPSEFKLCKQVISL